jgi:UDP-N-acetylmuramoyl-L-alanyl-D-glutamate--2,6-diaminopimelate ligase
VTLAALVAAIPGARSDGADGLEIHGLTLDSRAVRPGDAFFALPGAHADGTRFAAAAVAAGAVAVIGAPGTRVPGAACVEVPDPRLALAQAAVAFHGDPSRSLRVVAVTGTNGKTTTTWLLEAVFHAAGWASGVIGTTGIRFGGHSRPSAFTTPEAHQLQGLLAEMRAAGVRAVAMEASSHALALHRTHGLACEVAVFTNLTQDHLDFHGTMARYRDAKCMLFDGRNGPLHGAAVAVIGADDPAAAEFAAAAVTGGRRVVRFGAAEGTDLRLAAVTPHGAGLAVRLEEGGERHAFDLPLLGRYNAWNAAAAFAAARALGVPAVTAADGLARAPGVPGRLERVRAGQPFEVVVDYAHTPDALARALAACREHCAGRVLLVFGCGGDRDRGKRPAMGAAAAAGADAAWVTNDNPRSEDPAAIARDIVTGAGAAGLTVILDRRAAVAAAVGRAGPGDLVLIAGKGHETTQTIAGEVFPFDDRVVARECLLERGASAGEQP